MNKKRKREFFMKWSVVAALIMPLTYYLSCGSRIGSDWPTDGHDVGRSNVTADCPKLPLGESWRYVMAYPPSPAWPEPAAQDYWHGIHTLSSGTDYDTACRIVVAEEMLYFGSSADCRVYALDADSGRERWSFATEGPVRFAPSVYNGRIYAGSDDGSVYCLNARSGKLLWRTRLSEEDRRLPGNERMISLWPVRTALIADADTVWCSAGLFPTSGTFLCALDATDGSLLWRTSTDISPQGITALAQDRLVIPTGRTQPALFDRSTGALLGRLDSPGGSYAVVTAEGIVNGPGRGEGYVGLSDTDRSGVILTFAGLRMALKDSVAYIQTREGLTAVNRIRYAAFTADIAALEAERKEIIEKISAGTDRDTAVASLDSRLKALAAERESCRLWDRPLSQTSAMILAGDLLIAGGVDSVAVVGAADGSLRETIAVNGDACALAVAHDKLYVSTDKGVIHCFSGGKTSGNPKITDKSIKNRAGDTVSATGNAAGSLLPASLREKAHGMKGWALVAGCGTGRLACELARDTGCMIVATAPDQVAAEKARKTVKAAGFDNRITINIVDSDRLPYASNLFNLVVSETTAKDGAPPFSSAEIARVMRPCGGMACFFSPRGHKPLEEWDGDSPEVVWNVSTDGAVTAVKNALPGSGEWLQLYHDAANTASSPDSLKGPVALQWFGKPGPRGMIDRHHRTMSPLYKDGRVFIPGNDRIYAVDAYNGTLLWEKALPGSRRVGSLKDCGYIVIDGSRLMIAAGDSCLALDTATGAEDRVYRMPVRLEDRDSEWGYISSIGGRIVGTVQKKGASFRDQDFVGSPRNGSYLQEEDFRDVIASEGLFSLDGANGSMVWAYCHGTIMNNTVAIADGRVFFAETTNPAVNADSDGRIRIDRFCERDTNVVALDYETGKKLWERRVSLPYQHIMFLCHADNTVLVTGTYNVGTEVYYGLIAFDEATGSERWKTKYAATNIRGTGPAAPNGSHGEQWQHPVITGGTVYLRPYAFDLATGAKRDYIAFRGGHGCGGLTGSAYYLFGRGSTPRMYPTDVRETEGIELSTVSRPGCWLNMIPAGRLVIIPESSSGCTCGYPIQTSMAFAGS